MKHLIMTIVGIALMCFGFFCVGYNNGKRATYYDDTGHKYLKAFSTKGESSMWTVEDEAKLDATIKRWAENGSVCARYGHANNGMHVEQIYKCSMCGKEIRK